VVCKPVPAVGLELQGLQASEPRQGAAKLDALVVVAMTLGRDGSIFRASAVFSASSRNWFSASFSKTAILRSAAAAPGGERLYDVELMQSNSSTRSVMRCGIATSRAINPRNVSRCKRQWAGMTYKCAVPPVPPYTCKSSMLFGCWSADVHTSSNVAPAPSSRSLRTVSSRSSGAGCV
jgi:hypothetical protein